MVILWYFGLVDVLERALDARHALLNAPRNNGMLRCSMLATLARELCRSRGFAFTGVVMKSLAAFLTFVARREDRGPCAPLGSSRSPLGILGTKLR